MENILRDVRHDLRNLKNFAGVVDTIDKALIPVDVSSDVLLVAGVGIPLYIIEAAAEYGVKLGYLAYHIRKTGNWVDALKHIGYEALTEIPGIGAVGDLTNRYSNSVEKVSCTPD